MQADRRQGRPLGGKLAQSVLRPSCLCNHPGPLSCTPPQCCYLVHVLHDVLATGLQVADEGHLQETADRSYRGSVHQHSCRQARGTHLNGPIRN